MSEIVLKCINHVMTLVDTPDISSGNVEYDTVRFEFCPNWDGFGKTAVFYCSEEEVYYKVLDSNNICTIPKEVLQTPGKFKLGVFGSKDEKILTSIVLTYDVLEGAITYDLRPADPTPDIYSQLLGQYEDIKEELRAEIDVERKRIDNIVALEEGSTTGDAELMDIRVGADGTIYGSAGDAVRSQIKSLGAFPIIDEASGTEVVITDSSDRELRNIIVYGESTQNAEPTPDNPVDITHSEIHYIKITGKNLLDCNGLTEQTIRGVTYTPVYENGLLQYINVNGKNDGTGISNYMLPTFYGKGKYLINGAPNGGDSLTYHMATEIDEIWDGTKYLNDSNSKEVEIKDYFNFGIVVASGYTANNLKFYPMIRLVEVTDDTYEPYKGEVTELSYLDKSGAPFEFVIRYYTLKGIGEARDYIDSKSGKVVEKIKKVVLNGSETWTKVDNSEYSDNILRFYVIPNNLKVGAYLLCDKFVAKRSAERTTENVWAHNGTSNISVFIDKSRLNGDTVDDFKNWLVDNPVTVFYEVAETTEETLEEDTLKALRKLKSYKPTTIVTNDVGTLIDVEYVADTKLYIDKKIKELIQ